MQVRQQHKNSGNSSLLYFLAESNRKHWIGILPEPTVDYSETRLFEIMFLRLREVNRTFTTVRSNAICRSSSSRCCLASSWTRVPTTVTHFPPSSSSNYAAITSSCRRAFSSMSPGLFSSPKDRIQPTSRRCLSDDSSSTIELGADPVLDIQALQQSIVDLAPAMARGLATEGYFTVTGDDDATILPRDMIALLRKQSFHLRRQGRFEQSWSERIVSGGIKQRFDKEGVFACEPDGQDYDVAPDLIVYMSVLLQTLPVALNQSFEDPAAQSAVSSESFNPDLSNSSFNAKLAVTLPGGSTYPLHIDNPEGLASNDTRKLTCILYLNPDYQADRGDGGELRILLGNSSNDKETDDDTDTDLRTVDLTPEGGRLVLFWSDEIPHEVLPTAPSFVVTPDDNTDDVGLLVDNPLDRYALTIWIPTENYSTIHSESSSFRSLRDLAFR